MADRNPPLQSLRPAPTASDLVEKVGAGSVPVWALLPLRLFMGGTFAFAGLQKLADRGFTNASSPGSIQSQLQSSAHTSPVHFLVSIALHAPVAFGIMIALAELAVGIGTLIGLCTRLAAAGGMLLSLTFFLTVSFHTWPYYYGSDIVFLFAWTPLLLAGAMPVSLDERLRALVRREPDAPRGGLDLRRRILLRQAGAAGVVAVGAGIVAGITAAAGRVGGGPAPTDTPFRNGFTSPGPTTTITTSGSSAGATTTTSGAPSGKKLGPAADVPVGGATGFVDPSTSQPAFAVQPTAGEFKAFSAICTHEGCTVAFKDGEFRCPCHGSIYNGSSGQVIRGPAVMALPSIPIEDVQGTLYVDG